jgi:uncharacterized membrane protein
MTWYTFFKWIHVMGAIVWVGAAITLQLFALRALASPDRKRQATFAQDAEWIGMRVITPSSLVLLLAGIGAMENLGWSWGQNWVLFGLIAYAASFVVGAGFIGPESGRLGKLIADEGPESPLVTARIRRILAVSRAELVVLLAVVWNMVVKPVGNAGWFWTALAVAAAGVVAVGLGYLRGAEGVPAASPE